ncbi:hypothetical protein [Cedecea lapagei]|nr:hypothetical protein [Cedecea lapagei]
MIGNQSNKADAKCHRERKSSNEVFEFLEKKLFIWDGIPGKNWH